MSGVFRHCAVVHARSLWETVSTHVVQLVVWGTVQLKYFDVIENVGQ